MEDGLRALLRKITCFNQYGLNPCSCGGWSQRELHVSYQGVKSDVLILVLVEDGLRVFMEYLWLLYL